MIDIAKAGQIASEGKPEDTVCVSRRWLAQAVAEIMVGRIALSRQSEALDLAPPPPEFPAERSVRDGIVLL